MHEFVHRFLARRHKDREPFSGSARRRWGRNVRWLLFGCAGARTRAFPRWADTATSHARSLLTGRLTHAAEKSS